MHKYLYITVFFSGMVSLGLEMAASRLLGNVFGTSNLVWASIIGLILIYLAAGYFLGGIWADRKPFPKIFYLILFVAAISIGIVPLISKPVLRLAANAFDELQLGILMGSFTSVLILLCVPMILLGTASPFAIRLAIRENHNIGAISGKIYAISTLGSFFGTFLSVLVFIPTIGTYRTFLVFSAILAIIALVGFWKLGSRKLFMSSAIFLLLLIFVIIWGVGGPYKTTQNEIFETESAYNYIQVLEENDYRLLRLNEGQGIHSIYHPTVINYFGPWEQVMVGPFFNPAPYDINSIKSMAIIGLAAGTTARQASIVFNSIKIDGYEIDPKIIEVGQKYFDMNQPNLNVILQDGRWGLDHSSKHYQVISIDAYRPPYIPWYLTTREFFQIVREHLTDDGVMVINVGRSPTDRRLINALGSTILTVFPSAHVMDIPNAFNSIIFATVQPTQPNNLINNLTYLSNTEGINPLLLDSMRVAVANLQPPPAPFKVFTDDLSPVEWITNRMILDFLFSKNLEVLQ
jgi:predicted membrane-bound spermidine synthase